MTQEAQPFALQGPLVRPQNTLLKTILARDCSELLEFHVAARGRAGGRLGGGVPLRTPHVLAVLATDPSGAVEHFPLGLSGPVGKSARLAVGCALLRHACLSRPHTGMGRSCRGCWIPFRRPRLGSVGILFASGLSHDLAKTLVAWGADLLAWARALCEEVARVSKGDLVVCWWRCMLLA